jgi:hypothetical protein
VNGTRSALRRAARRDRKKLDELVAEAARLTGRPRKTFGLTRREKARMFRIRTRGLVPRRQRCTRFGCGSVYYGRPGSFYCSPEHEFAADVEYEAAWEAAWAADDDDDA